MAVLEPCAAALYELYSDSEQPGGNDEYEEEDLNWDFRRELINRVECDFTLYDRTFPYYTTPRFQTEKYRHRRNNSWRRVAKSLALDQNEVRVELCKSEWNILEADYCRYQTAKKKYGIQNVKPFKYAEEMAFLDVHIPARERQIKKSQRRIAETVAAVASMSAAREEKKVPVPKEKRRRREWRSSWRDWMDKEDEDSEEGRDSQEERAEVTYPRPRKRPTREEEKTEEREAFALVEGYYEEEMGNDSDCDGEEYEMMYDDEPRWVWENPIPMILAVKRMRCLHDPAHIYNMFPMRFANALEKMWDSVGTRTGLWGAPRHMKTEWEKQVKKYISFKKNEKAKKKKERPDPDWKYAPLMSFMDPYLFPDETAPNARRSLGESNMEEGEVGAQPPPEEQEDPSITEEEDEDKVFLLSLHADLKDLSPRSKSKAKLKIQALLHKLSFP